MKSIKKLFWVAAAFAAVLGFVACEQESGTSVVAEYEASTTIDNQNNQTATYNIKFYSDETFVSETTMGGQSAKASGTYTGDATKDGKITMKAEAGEEMEGTISGKVLSLGAMPLNRK